MQRPAVCLVFAALIAASCTERGVPTAPTPQAAEQPAPAPPAAFATAHLRGRVLDEGQAPVAGATIRAGGAPGGSAITDASGAFDIAVTINLQHRPLGFVFVNIEKAGYEASLSGASFASSESSSGIADVSQDYRLYRIRTIIAGAATRLVLEPDDPWCGLEAEWSCRIIRIRSLRAGTLIVEAIPDQDSGGIGLVVSGRYEYPFTLTPRMSIPVSAGQDTAVDVLTRFDGVGGKPVGSAKGLTVITSVLSEE